MNELESNLHDRLIAIWKRRGETPLEALNRLRESIPKLKDEVLSYAGRLDPMAEGVLLVLVGDAANKNREKYLGLDKTYIVEILFGIRTDTYDLLGIPQSLVVPHESFTRQDAESASATFTGTHIQHYPPFSSKTINGVPLHVLTRQGKVRSNDLPSQEITIYDIFINGWKEIFSQSLLKEVKELPEIIIGDFRQRETVAAWKKVLDQNPKYTFPILSITVSSASGAYMRALADEIGIALGVPALAYRIIRTCVGNLSRDDCVI